MIKELDAIVLTHDVNEHNLKRGDVGAVIHRYPADGFEVEFVTGEGKTAAVLTLTGDDIRDRKSTRELQSHSDLVCRLLLEKKKTCSSCNEPQAARLSCGTSLCSDSSRPEELPHHSSPKQPVRTRQGYAPSSTAA